MRGCSGLQPGHADIPSPAKVLQHPRATNLLFGLEQSQHRDVSVLSSSTECPPCPAQCRGWAPGQLLPGSWAVCTLHSISPADLCLWAAWPQPAPWSPGGVWNSLTLLSSAPLHGKSLTIHSGTTALLLLTCTEDREMIPLLLEQKTSPFWYFQHSWGLLLYTLVDLHEFFMAI